MKKQTNPLIIGIAGASASGKSTVAKKIVDYIDSQDIVTIIRHDDYYHDQAELTMEQRQAVNYDHPCAFDNERLIADLLDLKANRAIEKPIYDFSLHTRSAVSEIVEPSSIIIVEGILTLEEKALRDLMDIKIFVETPADICFIRRLLRDVKERNRSLESVIDQYMNTVRVMHEQFIEPSKRFADLIVPMGGDNSVAIDLLITKIYSAHQARNSV